MKRGELWFEDDPTAEEEPEVAATPSLCADLVSSGISSDLAAGSAGAVLLVQALADGTWLHLASGCRWFVDAAAARAVISAVARRDVVSDVCGSLGGLIDGEVLARIEALGWRHLPMPTIRDT